MLSLHRFSCVLDLSLTLLTWVHTDALKQSDILSAYLLTQPDRYKALRLVAVLLCGKGVIVVGCCLQRSVGKLLPNQVVWWGVKLGVLLLLKGAIALPSLIG